MIDVCLVPVGKMAADAIQEIYSHKSSVILTSRGQNAKMHRMEVLHENCSSSVIFALYVGLPKSLMGQPEPETFLSCKSVVTKLVLDGGLDGWIDHRSMTREKWNNPEDYLY